MVSSTEIPNAILNTRIVDGLIGIPKNPIIAAVNNKGIKFGSNEKDRYIPSNLGVRISEYLNQSIPNLMDYKFTSNMETLLDSISK